VFYAPRVCIKWLTLRPSTDQSHLYAPTQRTGSKHSAFSIIMRRRPYQQDALFIAARLSVRPSVHPLPATNSTTTAPHKTSKICRPGAAITCGRPPRACNSILFSGWPLSSHYQIPRLFQTFQVNTRNSSDTKRNACYSSLQYSCILSQLWQLCSSVDPME